MKKRNMKMTSVVLTAALAAVSLAGCGGSGKTETTVVAGSADTTAAETGSEAESSEAAGGEAKEGGYKVAMISDTSVSDGGWGASCYQAMVDAAAEKGWETVYTDNVATSDYATVMTDYAELGYDLIFAPGNQYTDAVKQVAEEYPEIKFALLNGTVETDNIQSILPDAEQIGYMAGALAGLMSKTNNIGFIGGMELDTTKAKVECYEKAAQKINPDIKVSSAYAGSFSDKVIACSVVTDNAALVKTCMEDIENGTFGNKTVYGDLSNGCLSVGTFSSVVPEDIQKQYLEVVDQIKAGTFLN